MDAQLQISEFGKILVFMILGILFIMLGYAANRLISPKKANNMKLSTYECGEETVGSSHLPINMRFYVIALVFLLFDVEIVFLFPWATIFGDKTIIAATPLWGWFTLTEMVIFIAILLVGLVYIWRKGDLEWLQSHTEFSTEGSKVPASLYEKINNETYTVRPFTMEAATDAPSATPVVNGAPPSMRRPPFKSAVKKTEE